MTTASPTIGLIVPPSHGRVPPDAEIFGDRFRFVARGLGIRSVSPEGFAPVTDSVVERARELRNAGAQAISLMGTSISFYQGASFTDSLRDKMEDVTGVPCTTMSHAVIRALRTLGATRVAVATSYIGALNEKLVAYFESQGLTVTAIEGLSLSGVGAAAEVSTRALVDLAKRVLDRDGSAQAIFMSCGALKTLDAIRSLEQETGLPAIGSSPAGFWDVVRTGGWNAGLDGQGRLFELDATA